MVQLQMLGSLAGIFWEKTGSEAFNETVHKIPARSIRKEEARFPVKPSAAGFRKRYTNLLPPGSVNRVRAKNLLFPGNTPLPVVKIILKITKINT